MYDKEQMDKVLLDSVLDLVAWDALALELSERSQWDYLVYHDALGRMREAGIKLDVARDIMAACVTHPSDLAVAVITLISIPPIESDADAAPEDDECCWAGEGCCGNHAADLAPIEHTFHDDEERLRWDAKESAEAEADYRSMT